MAKKNQSGEHPDATEYNDKTQGGGAREQQTQPEAALADDAGAIGETGETWDEVTELENEALTELQELQKRYDTLNEKYLRLYSEFENFRRRTAKEKIDMIKSASEGMLHDLLPVLDDFERAMASNADIDDIDAVKEGFELIFNKLFNTLKSKGLKPMDSMHQTFDTDLHDAITNIPAPEEELKGKVVDVAEKGYMLHDKVLRHAKVVVGQ